MTLTRKKSIFLKQLFVRHIQNPAESDQFDIGHKTLPGLDSLNGIFIHIQTIQLQMVCQFPLGYFHILADSRHVFTADIVCPILGFVDKHSITIDI